MLNGELMESLEGVNAEIVKSVAFILRVKRALNPSIEVGPCY